MRDLVPLAVTLRDLAGGYVEAQKWLEVVRRDGELALARLGLHGDGRLLLRQKAHDCGLLAPDGSCDTVQAAQLVILLDTLSVLPAPAPSSVQTQPLVFTVPSQAERLISPAQRLDLLVNDVIARSSRTLHIGGPFWNEKGWQQLRPVLLPALAQRHVHATFYVHPHESGRTEALDAMLHEAARYGSCCPMVGWRSTSLMHAKFVVRTVTAATSAPPTSSLGLGKHRSWVP
jgi:hypothetical protein